MFQKGNQYGKGRAVGSKQKRPNRKTLVSLLELIVSDLHLNYSTLTATDKIRLLASFHKLYLDDTEQDNVIKLLHLDSNEINQINKEINE